MEPPVAVLARHPVPIGAALGLASLPAHALLPHALSVDLAALVSTLIAGAYVGFAALDGRSGPVLIETGVALGFVLLALVAVQGPVMLLPLGYALHGVWDLAHRHPGIDTRMPRWYVPFCVAVDLVAGAGLAALWLWRGSSG